MNQAPDENGRPRPAPPAPPAPIPPITPAGRPNDAPPEEISAAEIEELLCELIRVPGHEEAPRNENDVMDFLRDRFEAEGVPVTFQEVGGGRRNLIAELKGRGGGPTLLLNAHGDTVPAGGMKEAFEPRLEGERIRGRGACDVKGAAAAMAGTVLGIRRNGRRLAGDLIFAATAGEESYSPGAAHLVRSGLRADFAVVAEPTGLELGIAHKGVVWLEAVFEGRAVHGSVPEKGINAIHQAARWVEAVRKKYIPALRERRHPLLGSPTVNLGTIQGGTRPVIVPARCVVRFERRMLPGENEAGVLAELRGLVDELRREDPEIKAAVEALPVFHGVPHGPWDGGGGNRLTEALAAAYEAEFGRPPRRLGLRFWTDAALLADLPGLRGLVVCGPGDIAQAHSDDEFVARRQLHAAHRLYTHAALNLCDAEP